MTIQSPANRPPESPPLRYVAIGRAIMSGTQHIASAITNSTAKRIALALNLYIANRKGK